mmetsp:Transcript_6737/g.9784  ORF Transcript_6737/g.9784 Transcript_6737/m.9784 type:complete len:135 (+) Transcript_6737:41-445(+)
MKVFIDQTTDSELFSDAYTIEQPEEFNGAIYIVKSKMVYLDEENEIAQDQEEAAQLGNQVNEISHVFNYTKVPTMKRSEYKKISIRTILTKSSSTIERTRKRRQNPRNAKRSNSILQHIKKMERKKIRTIRRIK